MERIAEALEVSYSRPVPAAAIATSPGLSFKKARAGSNAARKDLI